NVTRSSMPPYEEYIKEIEPLWESRWLTHMGVKHQEFEKKLCEYLGVEHTALFTNGHQGLRSVISTMGLTGEVITTPFTFASTTQAIAENGLTPVFCDIDPDNYTIDVNKIEELITDKTSAIVAVHVYGNVCDVEGIDRIAKKHGLKVIYDAAHAFGVKIGDRGIGTYGDASMFSFHATKVFHTIEGGGVVFKDPELVDKLFAAKYYGMEPGGKFISVAGNAKMTEFQAAMGLCNLRHIDEELAKRKAAAKRYIERLGNVDGIKPWTEQEGIENNYAYYPVTFDKAVFGKSRDEVMDELAKDNIFARKYFYPLCSELECYEGRFNADDTPIAKKASREILTLPLYADLTVEDVDRICDVILGGANK
ncbi:MAG: DegT/DnrJ/EryC1/StrS family aminotransferase, partial [Clostridia bacterium]|nr:DegT/DnrJ/EryC1/StrS family aminotransferase [Clostridia bacterium]